MKTTIILLSVLMSISNYSYAKTKNTIDFDKKRKEFIEVKNVTLDFHQGKDKYQYFSNSPTDEDYTEGEYSFSYPNVDYEEFDINNKKDMNFLNNYMARFSFAFKQYDNLTPQNFCDAFNKNEIDIFKVTMVHQNYVYNLLYQFKQKKIDQSKIIAHYEKIKNIYKCTHRGIHVLIVQHMLGDTHKLADKLKIRINKVSEKEALDKIKHVLLLDYFINEAQFDLFTKPNMASGGLLKLVKKNGIELSKLFNKEQTLATARKIVQLQWDAIDGKRDPMLDEYFDNEKLQARKDHFKRAFKNGFVEDLIKEEPNIYGEILLGLMNYASNYETFLKYKKEVGL